MGSHLKMIKSQSIIVICIKNLPPSAEPDPSPTPTLKRLIYKLGKNSAFETLSFPLQHQVHCLLVLLRQHKVPAGAAVAAATGATVAAAGAAGSCGRPRQAQTAEKRNPTRRNRPIADSTRPNQVQLRIAPAWVGSYRERLLSN